MGGAAEPGSLSITESARGLLLACHPVPTAGVTAVAALLGAGVGLTAGHVVVLTAAVLTGQVSIGWSNDRIDAGRDAGTGRQDKPAASGRVSLRLLGVAAAVSAVATVVLSVLLGPAAGAALLTLVVCGWAYNLGVKATAWSAVAYAVGFGAFAMAPYLALASHRPPPWWVPVTGALIGVAAHVANVLPDLRDDAATGVRGLPQRLGARASTVVLAAALAGASVVLGFGPPRPLTVAVVASVLGLGAATAITVLARRAPDSPATFRVIIVLALLDVGLALLH